MTGLLPSSTDLEAPEGVRQGVVQVEEVQLEVLHRLQAVESVLEEGEG